MPDSSDSPPTDVADALAADLTKAAQDQAQPPAEPSPPPDAGPQPTPAAPEPAPPAESQPSDDDALKLTKFIDQGWGKNFASKYRDDNATISGLVHAADLASRRDADAEYGRALREHEAAFQQYLQQQQPASAAPTPGSQVPTDAQIRAWRNELAKYGDNASPEARRGAERVQHDTEQALLKLAYRPEDILGPLIDARAGQQASETVQKQMAAEAQKQFINQFEENNRPWMYHGGRVSSDNLTPDGQTLLGYAKYAQSRGSSPADALEYAYYRLHAERSQQQQQQQPAPIQPVTPAAQHQPAVAAPPGGDPEEQYRQDLKTLDLEEHLLKLARQHPEAGL